MTVASEDPGLVAHPVGAEKYAVDLDMESNAARRGAYQFRVRAKTLYDRPHLTMILPDGTEIDLPPEALGHLPDPYVTRRFAAAALDNARRDAHDPALTHALTAEGDRRTLPGANLSDERTPVLVWSTATSTWNLAFLGDPAAVVGSAAWDDPHAIAGLVDSMGDPESVLALGGLLHSEQAAQMGARVAARALRRQRALPAVTLDEIRTILNPAGVCTAEKHTTPRVRLLALRSGNSQIPVAAAVVLPPWDRLLSRTERLLPYAQRTGLEAQRRKENMQRRVAATRAAFEGHGWRVVDLPDPHMRWRQGNAALMWVTPLDEQSWQTIAPAAQAAAAALDTARGRPLTVQ